jgi:hypothetical protein
MCTGSEYRPFLHDRHFSAASSFQTGVSRGRRVASNGMLALVSDRWRFTSNQPYPAKLLLRFVRHPSGTLRPPQLAASLVKNKKGLSFWLGVHALPEVQWPTYLDFLLLPMNADRAIGERP